MAEFGFNEDHELLRQTAERFAVQELAPGAKERGTENRMPDWYIKKIADMGFLGMTAKKKYGGQEMDMMSVGVVVEEFAKADIIAPHVMMTPTQFSILLEAGTEEQREQLIPPLIRGEAIYALGLTEPSCGTDAAAIRLTAVRDGDSYILNGEKAPATRAMQGTGIFVWAKTDPKAGARGVSCIYVPFDTPGVSRFELPYAGVIPLNCASVFFDSVRVPVTNRIGEEGKGFYMVMERFDVIRVLLCLVAIGQAQVSLNEIIEHAKQRTAFGQPIGKFEAVSFKIAEWATRLEAARLMCYRTLWMCDHGIRHSKETAMCKSYIPKLAFDCIHDCILVMGHAGYSKEFPLSQRMLNVMGWEIGDGTAEAQKLIIVRELMGREFLPYSK